MNKFLTGQDRSNVSQRNSTQSSSGGIYRRGKPGGPGRGRTSSNLGSMESQHFSLPPVLSETASDTTIQDSQLDQYEAVTIDASSILSQRKRRRRGKRRPGHAGPGRGHKTLLGKEFYHLHHIMSHITFPYHFHSNIFKDPNPLDKLNVENSIRDELESDPEEEDQEPIPRRASVRQASINESERQERERLNFERVPMPEPITARCWQKHRGIGCAAKGSNHIPDYYNSLEPV